MIHHKLKILPEYFLPVKEGKKTFELRNNDRKFKKADKVTLREWTENSGYTGREETFEIGYILPVDRFNKDNRVVFSLLKIKF